MIIIKLICALWNPLYKLDPLLLTIKKEEEEEEEEEGFDQIFKF